MIRSAHLLDFKEIFVFLGYVSVSKCCGCRHDGVKAFSVVFTVVARLVSYNHTTHVGNEMKNEFIPQVKLGLVALSFSEPY